MIEVTLNKTKKASKKEQVKILEPIISLSELLEEIEKDKKLITTLKEELELISQETSNKHD